MGYEWLNIDDKEFEYHKLQYTSPKLYTVELVKIFEEYQLHKQAKSIIDFGSGAGAVTNYFSNLYPQIEFKGLDLNPLYIEFANIKRSPNSTFEVFDVFKDTHKLNSFSVDGLFCFQTLSWLNDYMSFINLLETCRPEWSLVTSLFYDGPVDAEIVIKDYSRKMGDFDYRKSYYNIYSIPKFSETLLNIGYKIEEALKFNIQTDLPKPTNKSMSTYTEKLVDGSNIQISGPILMSWYTLIIKKIKNESFF